MSSKPLMLVSMPSCGSTWFAESLIKSGVAQSPSPIKEHFNPALNWRHAKEIGEVFGCEMPDFYNVIASNEVTDRQVFDVVYNVFVSEGYQFTKEIFMHYRLHQLSAVFDLVFLVRGMRDVFPPNRTRVRTWYHAMYSSMRDTGRFDDVLDVIELENESIETQCCIAFLQARYELISYATSNRCHLYEWEELMSLPKDELVDYVGNKALATCLIESRIAPSTARLHHMEQWKDAMNRAESMFKL